MQSRDRKSIRRVRWPRYYTLAVRVYFVASVGDLHNSEDNVCLVLNG